MGTRADLTPGEFVEVDITAAKHKIQVLRGKPEWWPSWLWPSPTMGEIIDYAILTKRT